MEVAQPADRGDRGSQAEQEVTLEEMREHVKPKEKAGRQRRQPEPLRRVGKQSLRRRLPNMVRRAIITLTYGSTTDFTRRVRRPVDVARLFNISATTVHSVIRKFQEQGCLLEDFDDRRKRRVSKVERIDPAIR